MRAAARVSVAALTGFLVPEMESIIDDDRKVKHSDLALKTEDALVNLPLLRIPEKEARLHAFLAVLRGWKLCLLFLTWPVPGGQGLRGGLLHANRSVF